MQKLRLQSGLVRQLQVQFLWYGTTSNRDKSGAYLFLPGTEGGQVRPEPGSSLNHISLSLSVLCFTVNVSRPPAALQALRTAPGPGLQRSGLH